MTKFLEIGLISTKNEDKMHRSDQLTPTSEKQRYIILDALRGFALLGICLANLPEFSLWTRYFRFGPLEWIWRMLTYGKWLPILKLQKTK